jgi:hypothetical protein
LVEVQVIMRPTERKPRGRVDITKVVVVVAANSGCERSRV